MPIKGTAQVVLEGQTLNLVPDAVSATGEVAWALMIFCLLKFFTWVWNRTLHEKIFWFGVFLLFKLLLDCISQARFVIRDGTSAKETYGGGRFLSAQVPAERGLFTLDFNYAVNPPCSFTAYATCPLPPRSNFIKARVEAGERKYEGETAV